MSWKTRKVPLITKDTRLCSTTSGSFEIAVHIRGRLSRVWKVRERKQL